MTAQGGAKLYVELGAQRVATLSAACAWREASTLARSLIRLARSHCMLRAEVDLLILWAQIALAVAPSDTSTALPAILRAVALCDRFQLTALRARVACLLVRVFMDEGSIAKAKAELASVTAQVLEHSPTAVRVCQHCTARACGAACCIVLCALGAQRLTLAPPPPVSLSRLGSPSPGPRRSAPAACKGEFFYLPLHFVRILLTI